MRAPRRMSGARRASANSNVTSRPRSPAPARRKPTTSARVGMPPPSPRRRTPARPTRRPPTQGQRRAQPLAGKINAQRAVFNKQNAQRAAMANQQKKPISATQATRRATRRPVQGSTPARRQNVKLQPTSAANRMNMQMRQQNNARRGRRR